MLSWAVDGAQSSQMKRKARPGEDAQPAGADDGSDGVGMQLQAVAPSGAWFAQGPALPFQLQLSAARAPGQIEFACPICLRPSQLPVRQDCGHVLCLHCIQQAFVTVGGCPLCQTRQIFSAQGNAVAVSAAMAIMQTNADAQQAMIEYGNGFQDPFGGTPAVSMGIDSSTGMSIGASPEPTDIHLEALSDFSDMIDLADLVASDSESQRPPLRHIPRHVNAPSWSSTTPTRTSRSSQRKVVGARPRSTSAGPVTSRKVVVRSSSANANLGGKRKRKSTEEPAMLMRWEELEVSGTRPEQRYDCGCTVYGSHMFVVGGIVGKLRSNDLYCVDLTDTSSPPRWTQPTILGSPPPTGSLLQVFVVNHTLYIIGGTSDGKFLSEVYAVNLASEEWRWEKIDVAGRPPSTRYWYSVAVIGNIAVLYGGYGHPHRLSDTFALRFDLPVPTWVELNPRGEIPGPASTHSVCVYYGKMFIFGGYDGKLRRGSLHSFEIDQITQDSIECTWQKVETRGKPPAPRYTHSAAVIGSKMIIYGGNTGCLKGDATILELDAEVPVWRAAKCDPVPTPREWHRVGVFNGAMYVFGGHIANGNDNGLYRLTFQ